MEISLINIGMMLFLLCRTRSGKKENFEIYINYLSKRI